MFEAVRHFFTSSDLIVVIVNIINIAIQALVLVLIYNGIIYLRKLIKYEEDTDIKKYERK